MAHEHNGSSSYAVDQASSSSAQPAAGPSNPYSQSENTQTRARKRYHAHPGCTLCSIVSALPDNLPPRRRSIDQTPVPSPTAATSLISSINSPTTPSRSTSPFRPPSPYGTAQREGREGSREEIVVAGREVVYWDEDVTVMRAEGKERLCEGGRHLIVIINKHLTSVYDLGPEDIPVLSKVNDLAHELLGGVFRSQAEVERGRTEDVRVGFVGTIMRDPQSSHAHLHAHAMIGPIDTRLPGAGFFRRNAVFGSMNWWSVEDLRAEIRESTSNNRVKSGYENRKRAPIDRVPDAGSRAGPPNALDDDPYVDSPPVSALLHPDDVFGVTRPDRKGKRNANLPRLQSPLWQQTDRAASTASIGSIRGDETEDYVAVNLKDQTAN